MSLAELRKQIDQRQAVVGVIGLGYVGLPVACMFAQAGFSVVGLDIKAERIATIGAGHNPIEGVEPGLAELIAEVVAAGRLQATTDYAQLRRADVVLIDVETPVDEDHVPQYAALKAACQSLGPVLKAGTLVIVESTIAPGTVDGVVLPELQAASGKVVNRDFYLGACPERVMPGRLLLNLKAMSRVCGGSTPETAETMAALYRVIVQGDLDEADCVTAELVKTAENAYRDVNIAFANELALACEVTGGDFLRVRELVNKSPGRNVLLAGAGVGGHCIPKDSWLLARGVNGLAPVQLLTAARKVNDYMPRHVADVVKQMVKASGRALSNARVAVLGYAYLEESDDTRNSPSEVLVAKLRELGAEVTVHDPWVPEYQGDLLERARGCDAAVVMVAHRTYKTLDLAALKAVLRTPVLVDGRRVFTAEKAHAAGLRYHAVGLGNREGQG